jgi:Ca-activated chloride channel homolog
MFRFGSVEWLFGLLLVPVVIVLFVVAARRRRGALDAFGDSELVQRLTGSVSVTARRVKASLVVVAIGMVAFALARPQFGTRVETVQSVGQDVVVALDLSVSMLAEDMAPSRLEVAKLSVRRLMSQLDGDRIGLVAFAADAFVQAPLTIDYGAAAMFLDAMHPDLMPVQGTDLGEALRVSLEALSRSERNARAIVLITDFEDHEGMDLEALRALNDGQVPVHIVGIGTPEGGPIPVFDANGRRDGFLRDEDGNVVTTRLDETRVIEVTNLWGGRYVRAADGGAGLDALFADIAGETGEELDEQQITVFEEQYQIFLALAVLMLLMEGLVSERKRREHEWSGRFG